jgi:homospermidine synthase
MDPSLLLPREKYEEESRKYSGEYSTFEIKTDKQALFYFGANHSRDPKNLQYPALKEYWQKFLKDTAGKEKIVLVEGSLRKLGKDKESAITKCGAEGGFITFLAHQAGVPIACPDISDEELIKRLPD